MPIIPYTAHDFRPPYQRINGSGELEVSWSQLVAAAVTVGRARWADVFRFGIHSWWELCLRAGIVFATLIEGPGGEVFQSDLYRFGLDPSEKGAVSYFLGLVASKVFANRVLGVIWLSHIDLYSEQLRPVLLGTSRPDLAGDNQHGEWIVFESKGRSGSFQEAALDRAKEQTRMVRSVSGQEPVARIGAVTHFTGGRMQMTLSDPPKKHPKAVSIHLSLEKFLNQYYASLRQLVRTSGFKRMVVGGFAFLTVELPIVDLTVGLREDFVSDDVLVKPVHSIEQDDLYIGSDGILVKLGPAWSKESMQKQPEEREWNR